MATRFITVSIEIMHDENLNNSQKFILAEIEQLTQLERGCIAQNNHFAELIGIARESVSRNISDLENKGYINIETVKGSRNHERILTLNEMLTPLNKTSRPPKQNVKTPLTKHQETKENKTINKTINKWTPFLIIEQYKKYISTEQEKVKESKSVNEIVLRHKEFMPQIHKGIYYFSIHLKNTKRESEYYPSLLNFIKDKTYLDYQEPIKKEYNQQEQVY